MENFVENLPDSLSYPQKTQAMWKEFAGLDFSGHTPNHVLALAYAKAVAGRNIKLYPIQRQGAGYHSVDQDVDFASATALRQHQRDKDFLERFMPSVALFEQTSKVSWEDYFPLLRYQILSNPDITTIYQVNQEMAVRIKETIKTVQSVEDLIEAVATKRYTKARVRRLLTYILVQARESDLPEGIHVLGFTEKRQATSQVFERAGRSSQPNWQRTLGCYDPKGRPDLPTGKSKYSRAEFWKSTD